MNDMNENDDAESARCPQCQKPLDISDGSVVVGYPCHGCGGLWLEKKTMDVVVSRLDPQAIMLGESASAMAEDPAPPHASNPPCPMCGQPMQTLVLPSTDVEVDQCTEHGTWLDRGELETIVHELSRMLQQAAAAMPTTEAPGIDQHVMRKKMTELYGLDPAIRATKLPFVLEEMLEAWELITTGHVAPVPTFESGQEDPDDDFK